jgi:hypothetical protein
MEFVSSWAASFNEPPNRSIGVPLSVQRQQRPKIDGSGIATGVASATPGRPESPWSVASTFQPNVTDSPTVPGRGIQK